jgi:integrase
MSIYKPAKSPYWQYDFEVRGHRFFGSTKCTTKREAEVVERAEREKAEQTVKQARAAATSLRLDDVAGRYWQEVGQHHAGARNTERQIGYVIEFFGKDKLLTDITDDDLTKLVAWRRGHRSRSGELISPFTVNDVTQQLRELFSRAKLWGVRFDHEPEWRKHWLKEPQERVRELVGDEGDRLEAATRDDYAPFFAFARASGLRLNECLLRWSEVDWSARQITKTGKGGKRVSVPITPVIREILWPLRGHHPDFVFTYEAQRDIDKVVQGKRYYLVKGERFPVSYSGVSTAWRRLRTRAGVQGFRFHDHRHDLGSKVLRATGNLKLVQKALNHSSIRSTVRYAHVLDEDVAAALEDYQESRNNPRNLRDKKVS